MSETSKPWGVPPRALAATIFSALSIVLLHVYGQVHWLPTRLSRGDSDLLRRVLELVGPPRDHLDLLHKATAMIAFAWGMWSVRTEPRIVGWIAAVVSLVALALAFAVTI